MRQVRICRSNRIDHIKQELVNFEEWNEATDEQLFEFQLIADIGNDLFGPDSHWLESRVLPHDRDHPDRAVWSLVTNSLRAWIEGDMRAHMRYYTPGAALITPVGGCHRGQDSLLEAFSMERSRMPQLNMNIERAQFSYPGPDVAVVMMEGSLTHAHLEQQQRWASTQTAVFVDDEWLFAAHQIFHVR